MNTGRAGIGVGVVAGIVSALLCATFLTRSPLAFLLVFLAPLPLMVAGLGWGWLSAAIGTAFVGVVIAILGTPALAAAFLIAVAGPTVILSYVCALGRRLDAEGAPGGVEWYPVGRMLVWIVGIAAGVATAFVLSFGTSMASYLETLRGPVTQTIQQLPALGFRIPPEGAQREGFVTLMSMMLAFSTAVMTFALHAFNLWLAGVVVEKSNRAPRPWPDLPSLEIPREAIPFYLAALALAFFAPGLVGLVGGLFAVTFTLAYMLQGLAVLHDTSRGLGARRFVLATTYALLFLFSAPLVLVIALVGLVDPILRLRERARERRASRPPGDGGFL